MKKEIAGTRHLEKEEKISARDNRVRFDPLAFFCARLHPSIIKDVEDVAARRKEGSHVNSSFVVSPLLFLL